MSPIEKIEEYLKQQSIFYISTIDGDRPRCRPLGFFMVYEGTLYFGVGTFKEVYRQMQENPLVEICASDGRGFLRYYGKAVFTQEPAIMSAVFEAMPHMANIYNERTGYQLGVFSLTDATAEFRNLLEIEEKFEL